VSRSAWRSPSRRVHSSLEVLPSAPPRSRCPPPELRPCPCAACEAGRSGCRSAGRELDRAQSRSGSAAHATGRAPGSSAGMAAAVPWSADHSVDRSADRSSAACARRAQQRTHRPARTHPVRDSRRLACEARRISTDALGRANPQTNFPVLAPNSRQSGRGSSGLRRLTAVSRCRVPAATTPPNPAQTCGKRLRKANSSGVGKRQGFPGPGISRPPHSTALPPLQGGRRQG
jgi:hypothetical protein